jgi:hypothetical protein
MKTRTTRLAARLALRPAGFPGRAASSAKSARPSQPTSSAIRPDLVARVRARLAAGFYDLPECLEHAVDRMMDREELAA